MLPSTLAKSEGNKNTWVKKLTHQKNLSEKKKKTKKNYSDLGYQISPLFEFFCLLFWPDTT